jgi:hypothetical protein
MTDVMPERQVVDLDALVDGGEAASAADELDAVDEQLLARLVGRARAGGLQLTGEGGLLGHLTKRLVESALEGEMTDHLGYDKHDVAGRDGGNSRNGHRSKTVLTEVGPVEIEVPRDREGSFDPKIVAKRQKRQKRLSGVDEMVISLSVVVHVLLASIFVAIVLSVVAPPLYWARPWPRWAVYLAAVLGITAQTVLLLIVVIVGVLHWRTAMTSGELAALAVFYVGALSFNVWSLARFHRHPNNDDDQ